MKNRIHIPAVALFNAILNMGDMMASREFPLIGTKPPRKPDPDRVALAAVRRDMQNNRRLDAMQASLRGQYKGHAIHKRYQG